MIIERRLAKKNETVLRGSTTITSSTGQAFTVQHGLAQKEKI
jgi:hypothetical protein